MVGPDDDGVLSLRHEDTTFGLKVLVEPPILTTIKYVKRDRPRHEDGPEFTKATRPRDGPAAIDIMLPIGQARPETD